MDKKSFNFVMIIFITLVLLIIIEGSMQDSFVAIVGSLILALYITYEAYNKEKAKRKLAEEFGKRMAERVKELEK